MKVSVPQSKDILHLSKNRILEKSIRPFLSRQWGTTEQAMGDIANRTAEEPEDL
jgi:hypothetical protein